MDEKSKMKEIFNILTKKRMIILFVLLALYIIIDISIALAWVFFFDNKSGFIAISVLLIPVMFIATLYIVFDVLIFMNNRRRFLKRKEYLRYYDEIKNAPLYSTSKGMITRKTIILPPTKNKTDKMKDPNLCEHIWPFEELLWVYVSRTSQSINHIHVADDDKIICNNIYGETLVLPFRIDEKEFFKYLSSVNKNVILGYDLKKEDIYKSMIRNRE